MTGSEPAAHRSGPPAAVRENVSEAELETAIARVTRALATADDETVADLVAERKALRSERDRARMPENVIDAAHKFGKKSN